MSRYSWTSTIIYVGTSNYVKPHCCHQQLISSPFPLSYILKLTHSAEAISRIIVPKQLLKRKVQ